jgi:hypothetical protein
LARLRKERQGNGSRLSKELEQVERAIKRCVDFITGGDGDPGSVRDKLRELERRRSDIVAELKTSQADVSIDIHPNLPDLYRREVASLQQVLDDESTRPQTVDTLRFLIDRIEVRPGISRGRCELVIVGALAQVLAFAHEHTAAPRRADGTSLVVAGAAATFTELLFFFPDARFTNFWSCPAKPSGQPPMTARNTVFFLRCNQIGRLGNTNLRSVGYRCGSDIVVGCRVRG